MNQRRQVIHLINSKNAEMVKYQNEQIQAEKLKYNQYKLQKWELYRQVRDARLDQYIKLIKAQKFLKLYASKQVLHTIVKYLWK